MPSIPSQKATSLSRHGWQSHVTHCDHLAPTTVLLCCHITMLFECLHLPVAELLQHDLKGTPPCATRLSCSADELPQRATPPVTLSLVPRHATDLDARQAWHARQGQQRLCLCPRSSKEEAETARSREHKAQTEPGLIPSRCLPLHPDAHSPTPPCIAVAFSPEDDGLQRQVLKHRQRGSADLELPEVQLLYRRQGRNCKEARDAMKGQILIL